MGKVLTHNFLLHINRFQTCPVAPGRGFRGLGLSMVVLMVTFSGVFQQLCFEKKNQNETFCCEQNTPQINSAASRKQNTSAWFCFSRADAPPQKSKLLSESRIERRSGTLTKPIHNLAWRAPPKSKLTHSNVANLLLYCVTRATRQMLWLCISAWWASQRTRPALIES